MKTRHTVAVGLLTVFALTLSAHGQSTAGLGRFNIPFSFMVGTKEMPAGKYELTQQTNPSILALRNKDNNDATYVQVIERLAQVDSSAKHRARIVFDEAGDKLYLSEFWPAGREDGYLLGITKGEQKHVIVTQK